MENHKFLTFQKAEKIAEEYNTPCYIYDETSLEKQAKKALAFPNAYGLTVRYAMKAASNASILKLFHKLGIEIDASSSYEAIRAMRAGIPAKNISLSSQQLPSNLYNLVKDGIWFNACSLRQLDEFGKIFPGGKIGVRINPGLGSGGTNRTNVGGISSSFGIWHEYIRDILDIAKKHNLTITKIHTHIGSGSDPKVWQKVAQMSLNTVKKFPDVDTLDMGGGFKVARMPYEADTDLEEIGVPIMKAIKDFALTTGRKLHFEIEPGTFLVANCAVILARIQDICDTGKEGYSFIKLDSGMTDILRPSIYGAQHPISILSNRTSSTRKRYVVVGHCCESGDILTPAAGNPETLSPREIPEPNIGDFCVIGGTGAYCSSMSPSNYNSFPASPEILIKKDGSLKLIRKRENIEQLTENEL